jgi:hypothetical protein
MSTERIHYNVVCDDNITLRCANLGCTNDLLPEQTIVIKEDGTVYCSETCAEAIAS